MDQNFLYKLDNHNLKIYNDSVVSSLNIPLTIILRGV